MNALNLLKWIATGEGAVECDPEAFIELVDQGLIHVAEEESEFPNFNDVTITEKGWNVLDRESRFDIMEENIDAILARYPQKGRLH